MLPKESSARQARVGTRADGHVCLRTPCYYCLTRSSKPLPAEILTGRPPTPPSAGIHQVDLSGVRPETRGLIVELVTELCGRTYDVDLKSAVLDLGSLPGTSRSTVFELIRQLDEHDAGGLRLVDRRDADLTLVARFTLDRDAIVRGCEPYRPDLLIRPPGDQIGAHVGDILPRREVVADLAAIARLFDVEDELPARRVHLVSPTGDMCWFEKRMRREHDRVVKDVYRVPSVLDRLTSNF